MIDKDEFLQSVCEAIKEETCNEYLAALNVLSDSLNGPQKHIFDWILKEMAQVVLHQEKAINGLAKKIEQLQKELTFKGVPDDGC